MRLATEEGYTIERAWWSAYENDHPRMEHWQSFFGVKSGGSSSSSPAVDDPRDKRIALLQKKIGELFRQAQNARSRSPRGKKNSRNQLAPPAPAQMLALPAPAMQKKRSNKGKGKGKKEQGTADHDLPSTHGLASQSAAKVHCRRAERPGSVLCVPVQHLHAFSLLAVACLQWLRKAQRGLRRLQVPLSMSQQQQSEQSSRPLAAVCVPAHPPHRSDAHRSGIPSLGSVCWSVTTS